MSLYEDKIKVVKINKMMMLQKIMYMSEIDFEFYQYDICLLPMQLTKSIVIY